jgi:hypothetical protein
MARQMAGVLTDMEAMPAECGVLLGILKLLIPIELAALRHTQEQYIFTGNGETGVRQTPLIQ